MKRRRGFTLIEFLVVSCILGMAALAVFSAFAGGLRVYGRVIRFGEARSELLLELCSIERDLRNAVPFSSAPFSGQAHRVEFAAQVYRAPAQGGEEYPVIGTISYYIDPGSGRLIREEKPYPGSPSAAKAPDNRTRLSSAVSSVAFRYWAADVAAGTGEWKDSWAPGEGIPMAVGVEISGPPGGKILTESGNVIIPVGGKKG